MAGMTQKRALKALFSANQYSQKIFEYIIATK